jgi:hypothetical protein
MGQDFEYAYHYTTSQKLQDMRKAGAVKPLSYPYSCDCFGSETAKKIVSERVREIVTYDFYIVCLFEPEDKGWKESGLLKELWEYTTRDVMIKLPIIDRESAFVMDASYLSPFLVKPKHGQDAELYNQLQALTPSQMVRRKFFRQYLESTTRLDDYDGSFGAPELWLSQETPIGLTSIVERSMFERSFWSLDNLRKFLA